MSESNGNSYSFNSEADDDAWLRREISGLCSDAIADSRYPDIEGKLLREIAHDSVRLNFEDFINPHITRIVIKTAMKDFYYKPIGLVKEGLLVRDEAAEETVLIRGTAYCLSLDTFTDEYAYSMFNKHFLGKNYPATTKEGQSLSVPFIAARGQIGQHGYLVVSDVYDTGQVEEMLHANDLDARESGLRYGPDGSLAGQYFLHEETQTVQATVLDIDVEYLTTPTS